MRKIFDVELAAQDGSFTTLTLPAAPYAVLDALEKLRLEENEEPSWAVVHCRRCEELVGFLDLNGSFFELNALCQRLAVLNEDELAVVEGLARMEHGGDALPVPLPQLINLAYSTDQCYLAEEAVSDDTLGRFCAENGFVPEADGLSDETFELLDFAKIGRLFRQNEDGVFTRRGYVQRYGEVRNVYQNLDLTPKKPDYSVLLALEDGGEVRLPALPEELDGAKWGRCLDCQAPALTGAEGSAAAFNQLARRIEMIDGDGQMPKFKALLDAMSCRELDSALLLADGLDRYAFSADLRTPEEVARANLNVVMPDDEVEFMEPYLKLYAYGQALVEQGGGTLTGYGLIERVDGQQIHTMEEKPDFGGMEMI